MTYLLIFFVIAVALAPLSHFVPSKRQREIASMREYAAVHGLFVEFRNLPGGKVSGSAAPGKAAQEIIYYGKRLPPARAKAPKPCAWLRDGQQWRSLERKSVVPAPPQQAPAAVLGASVDEASCGIYWREAGGAEPVEQIRQLLERWSGQLRS